MTRLRVASLLFSCVLLFACCVSTRISARPLSARVSELLSMDDEQLMALDEQPAELHDITRQQQQQTQTQQHEDQILIETKHKPTTPQQQHEEAATPAASSSEEHSLAETQSQSEAQVEAEVTAEASQEPAADAAADPAADAAAAEPAAAPAPEPEPEKPVIPIESAKVRLEKAKIEIAQLEQKIANQTEQVAEFTSVPLPMISGEPVSSGSNYFSHHITNLKSSAGIVAKDNAAFLTQTDARCVICQYVVQQAMGLLAGKPLATGGATAGGKRAAERAAAASPAAPTAFLEMESELDAERNTYRRQGRPMRRERTRRSSRAPRPNRRRTARGGRGGARRTGGGRRIRKDIGGRVAGGFGRRPYMGQNLRLMNAITYPRQLNDFGFDENARNRQADILAHRPRQARFSRGELKAAQAKWDATRAEYQKLYSGVYAAFEKLCSKRMPLAYSAYCTEMMKDYRYIAQGIQYGDRAQSICMNGNWCDRQSYIRHAVHAYFVRESGDN